MPGLRVVDRISRHSRYSPVSSTGEADPHGINEEALEEATQVIQLHAGRVSEDTTLVLPEDPRVHEYRAQWYQSCADLMGPIPLKLPPFREINHEIHLVDEAATYNYHMPRCPEALRPLLHEKIQRYISAGWWEMSPASQAAPLLCLPKKDNGL
ncbi:hypothetical protein DFH07DRAFT_973947 [Mycena maculata]|uniref:Uncharacterized protein n=1 Tax=Mycena maculata TaxID=230809 RepID=A0AAD7HAC8_9AGAR|nr:hypothetical protein DFH07DRAFT_973947 [Mycena maculata]